MAWVFVNQTKFYLHEDETLLAGLLRVGIDAPHQCCEGYCGTCKIKHNHANAGHPVPKLHYHTDPLVMLAEDELLPCCCHVTGVLILALDYESS